MVFSFLLQAKMQVVLPIAAPKTDLALPLSCLVTLGLPPSWRWRHRSSEPVSLWLFAVRPSPPRPSQPLLRPRCCRARHACQHSWQGACQVPHPIPPLRPCSLGESLELGLHLLLLWQE